jgi:predicted PurR-regulated permease PerM
MEENDKDETLPAKATDEDVLKELGDDENTNEDCEVEQDTFVYLKSSSIISILIVVIISLVCILATSLVVKTILQSRGITHSLSVYFGFTPNRTIDESILTYWEPKSVSDEQPIETIPTIINSSSSTRPPPVVLSHAEKNAQTNFRNIILPSLFLLSILFGFLAFYMRRHHHHYPAWGARPKRPERYETIELKPPKTTETNDHI